MKIIKFEELPIWRLSLKITKDIYDLTSKKEFQRDFGLRDQIRRASEFKKINEELESLGNQIGGLIYYLTKRKFNQSVIRNP